MKPDSMGRQTVSSIRLSSNRGHDESYPSQSPLLGTALNARPTGPALGCGMTMTQHTFFLSRVGDSVVGCILRGHRPITSMVWGWEHGVGADVSAGTRQSLKEQEGSLDRTFPQPQGHGMPCSASCPQSCPHTLICQVSGHPSWPGRRWTVYPV